MNLQVKIEPAKTNEDIISIKNLALETWNEHYQSIISKKQIDYMLNKFQSTEAITEQINQGYEYYLINATQNVGYIAIKKESDKLFLSKLYLKKEYRGMGIGSKSINFVKNKAVEYKTKEIYLTVNKININSISTYKKNRFKITNAVVNDIGNEFIMDDFIMTYSVQQN